MLAFMSALAAAFAAIAQAPASQPPLPPTGKWVVDFAEAQCVATRNYGTEADPLLLGFKAPPIGDVLQIVIVRPGTAAPAQVAGEVLIDDRAPIRTTLFKYGVASTKRRALLVNVPRSAIEPLRGASTLQVRVRERGSQMRGSRLMEGANHFETGFRLSQMAPLLKTMDDCVADLKQVWRVFDESSGVAPANTFGPAGDLASIFGSDDYPAVAIDKEQTGSVRFVLLVDEAGRIADCTVIETSGVASLDAQSCAIVKERGRFRPATGADGKPTKGAFIQRVTWRIQ